MSSAPQRYSLLCANFFDRSRSATYVDEAQDTYQS